MAGIFRFANPGSDIRKFISTYKVLYTKLKDKNDFTHDDGFETLIENSLVSSSGAIGQEAILRSRRADRSRDPLYNQHKMYSELYRMLGWYEPGTMNTKFNIPEFGWYIHEADDDLSRKLFELNLFHIASPHPLTNIRGNNILRPFPLILKLLLNLDGHIQREEIIITVLACANDTNPDYLNQAVEKIQKIRGEDGGLKRLKANIDTIVTEHGISANTLGNYTRFIFGALKWLDLAQPVRVRGIYDKSIVMYRLTEYGKTIAEELITKVDIRNDDIALYTIEERAAFGLFSIYYHLERLGYDLSDPESQKDIKHLKEKCQRIIDAYDLDNNDFLYFGNQEASTEERTAMKTLLADD